MSSFYISMKYLALYLSVHPLIPMFVSIPPMGLLFHFLVCLFVYVCVLLDKILCSPG